jgi:EmrB/QacA subfamily drug resistance transporter
MTQTTSRHAATAAPDEKTQHRQILEALSGLLMVLFVSMISATVVSVALPRIIGALNGTQGQYTWVITATLLAATVTTPIWGKLADLYPKKALVQIAIVIFTIGSIMCGFAQNTPQLIGFRVIQGLGVGGLQALVQVAIASMIPPRERGKYNGYLGAVMALATVGGPLLGGLIVDTSWLGWRWCFFVGVPFSIIGLVLLAKTLHLPHTRREDVHIDFPGAVLIAASVSLLLIWVSFAGNSFDWMSWQTAAMVGPAVVLAVIFVLVERRSREPIVPLGIVRQRTTALAILGSIAVGMAMFGGAFFLAQYFQLGRGFSPTRAGLLTIPLMGGVLVSSTVAGRLISKTGKIKPYIVAGSFLLVAGFALLGTTDHLTSLWLMGIYMALVGIGVGMTMQNLVLAVQNTVPLKDLGSSSATVAFFRSLGGTIGVSVLGAVLANKVASNIASGMAAAGIPAQSGGSADMPPAVQSIVHVAYGDATALTFMIAAFIGVVGVIAALALPKIRLRTTLDVTPAETGTAQK